LQNCDRKNGYYIFVQDSENLKSKTARSKSVSYELRETYMLASARAYFHADTRSRNVGACLRNYLAFYNAVGAHVATPKRSDDEA
jgi:hypothetical protein